MKYALLIVLALISSIASCSTPSPTPDGERTRFEGLEGRGGVRLATWNIYWLDVPDKGKSKRTEQDYVRLRAYANRLDADLVVLQEIAGVEALALVYPEETHTLVCEDSSKPQKVCAALEKASGLRIEKLPDLAALNVSGGLRQGLDVMIYRGDEPVLRVLGVHLKSGCFSDASSGASCDKLTKQIPVLEAWAEARGAEGLPFVMMGDFNRRFSAADSIFQDLDDAEPPSSDLMRSIPDGETAPCYDEKYPEYIDHVLLSPALHGRVKASAQLVYDEKDFGTFRKKISDHCPVYVDLEGL